MNHDERQALLGFLGNVYGQTKLLDQNIVGSSTNLQPKSDNIIRPIFEQVLATPVSTETLTSNNEPTFIGSETQPLHETGTFDGAAFPQLYTNLPTQMVGEFEGRNLSPTVDPIVSAIDRLTDSVKDLIKLLEPAMKKKSYYKKRNAEKNTTDPEQTPVSEVSGHNI